MGAEGISIVRRGTEKAFGPVPVMLLYIYNMEERPLQIGGRTWINLNEELISAGFAISHHGRLPISKPVNVLYSWKPPVLPKLDDMFWGHVTWVNRAGEIFLHDVKANSKLEEIRNWLNDAYNGTEPTTSDLNCRKGDLCIAR